MELKKFSRDCENELLEFVNSQKDNINVISIAQAKNNDYSLFYELIEENK